MTQYVTIVATVALPDDSPLDPDDLTDEVTGLLDRWNLELVPTGWAPLAGDVAELSDLPHDSLVVLDLNPRLGKFTVELGINLDGQRVCAAEAGVFTSKEAAEVFAKAAIGRTVDEIAAASPPKFVSQMDSDRWDLPVAGWTIEQFTDEVGTIESWESAT